MFLMVETGFPCTLDTFFHFADGMCPFPCTCPGQPFDDSLPVRGTCGLKGPAHCCLAPWLPIHAVVYQLEFCCTRNEVGHLWSEAYVTGGWVFHHPGRVGLRAMMASEANSRSKSNLLLVPM